MVEAPGCLTGTQPPLSNTVVTSEKKKIRSKNRAKRELGLDWVAL